MTWRLGERWAQLRVDAAHGTSVVEWNEEDGSVKTCAVTRG
ncbi:hypothetical protein [Propioniciclava flava]